MKVFFEKLFYYDIKIYLCITIERNGIINTQNFKIMKASQPTNLVTFSNVEMMKLHILGQCKVKFSSVQNLEEANAIASLFVYQTEMIETQVFSFVCEELEKRLQMKLIELGL